MTPAERHALEKKALSDQFLADALEGAESVSSENFSLDVEELNKKISGTKTSTWQWPMRIAASVVGVTLVGAVFFYSLRPDEIQLAQTSKQKDSVTNNAKPDTALIASNKEEKKSKTITTGEISAKSKTDTDGFIALSSKNPKAESILETEISNIITSSGGASNTKPAAEHDVVSKEKNSSAFIVRDSIATEIADSEPTTAAPILQQQPKLSETKAMRAQKSETTTNNTLTVTGQVRDQQGQPLPGVNITMKGLTSGTVTDADGKYSINLPTENSTIVYSFIGFVPQEIPIDRTKAYADVQLMEDATQLSEVVVTGYGEKKTSEEPIVRLAEPVGGRKAYDQYLEDKKLYPQQALDNKVEGKVIIEFTVSVVGEISDFKVIRKLGSGCDEEVMRLVKTGPRWSPSYIDNEAVESLVRIKTRFQLPAK